MATVMMISAVWAVPAAAQTVTVSVDGTAAGTPLKTVWSWYGYDEGNYTTTQPSKDLLKTVVKANREQVFIRQHFLLNNSSGNPGLKWGATDVYSETTGGDPIYNWTVLDSITDAVVGGGALPYFQMSFMPKALSSAASTVSYRNTSSTALDGGCFYPPKDFAKWSTMIRAVATHVKQRYPDMETKWIWELWNEPDIGYYMPTTSSATTKMANFQTLFDYTEQAVHTVLPDAVLGGPEVATSSNVQSFLQHCATGTNAATGQIGTRLDLISFHAKGGTAVVSTGGSHVQMNLGNQLRLHRTGFNAVASFPQYKSKPIVVGEADPDGCAACPQDQYPADAYRNVPAYGAYEAAMMKHSLMLADSLGVNLRALLAWAWLFNDQPYFRGFRTLSTNGVHKPVLNVFKMMGRLRGQRVPVVSSGALGLAAILTSSVRGSQPDIDGMATKSDSLLQLLVWNYHDDLLPVAAATVNLTLKVPAGFPAKLLLTHWRVDSTHSNAYTKWLALGSPQSHTPSQLDTLHKYMQLETYAAPQLVDVVGGQIQLSFALPRFGVSLVEAAWPVLGCTTPGYLEYNPGANYDDGSHCVTGIPGFRTRHSEPIAFRGNMLEIDLGESYRVRVLDASGRILFTARASGVHRYALPASAAHGALQVEVRTTRGRLFQKSIIRS